MIVDPDDPGEDPPLTAHQAWADATLFDSLLFDPAVKWELGSPPQFGLDPLLPHWPTTSSGLRACWSGSGLPRADFSRLADGLIVIGQKAYDDEDLYSTMEIAGELLPVECEGEQFYIWNILVCLNAIDADRSEWIRRPNYSAGDMGEFSRPVLRLDCLGRSSAFTLPQSYGREFFCVTPWYAETDFFKLYHDRGYSGLKWTPVDSYEVRN